MKAEGERLTFYMNNKPIWSGVDDLPPFTQGHVGIMVYSSGSGDLLEVDWASMNGGSAMPVFQDDFENPVSGDWATSTSSGAYPWFFPQNSNGFDFDAKYATSGTYNLWGYDQASVSDIRMQMTRNINIPSNARPLRRTRRAWSSL